MYVVQIIFMILGLIVYGSIPVIFCKMITDKNNNYHSENNEDYKNF